MSSRNSITGPGTGQDGMAEVLDRLHDGVAVFDSDDNLIFANEVCRDLFRPITESFTPGTSFAALMGAAGAKKMIADAFFGPGEIDFSDGRTVLLRESRMPSGGVVRTFTDLTEYRLAEQQIAYMASHDEVTGLPNRSLFLDRLDVSLRQAAREKTRIAVLFIDLDGFKAVNDRLGHEAGDMILHQVAVRLVARVRASDTVARYGGDEFTVILNQISNAQDVSRVAQSIVEELTRPFTAKRETVMIGASVGIALYPEHSESADALVRIADKAMYEVKHAGKRGYRLASMGGR
ncbi:MAG: diguanylate cyclase [Rhodospirillales bacterium]